MFWLIELTQGLIDRRGYGDPGASSEEKQGWRYNTPELTLSRSGGSWIRKSNKGHIANQDLSSTQFAALALFSAQRFGVKVPVLESGKVGFGRKRKKLEILGAQNPASSVDAKFTSTLQLDAAVDNRLLKTHFGNAAGSAGSSSIRPACDCITISSIPAVPPKLPSIWNG